MSGKGKSKGSSGKTKAAPTQVPKGTKPKQSAHGKACHIRARKAIVNKLLGRKQMVRRRPLAPRSTHRRPDH